MSKLTEVRYALKGNGSVVIVSEPSYDNCLPTGSLNYQVVFKVIPEEPIITADGMQKFMEGLFPDGPEPDFSRPFRSGDNEFCGPYMELGSLRFVDEIAKQRNPLVITLTPDEREAYSDDVLARAGYRDGRKRTKTMSRDVKRTTIVRTYPCRGVAIDPQKSLVDIVFLDDLKSSIGRKKFRELSGA